MEFLETLETLRADDASVGRLFGREGVGARHRNRGPDYERRLHEAIVFMRELVRGQRPMHHLGEALGTADFPLLFGDILDRQLLSNYMEAPATYTAYAKVATVSDFRTVKRFAIDGSQAVLAAVGQQEEYPESKLSDSVFSYSVSKYGRQTPFDWESIINDDLDALKDIPERYGRAARRSEEKFVTALFGGNFGTFFTTAHKNIVTAAAGATLDNPPLSIAGLQAAMLLMGKFVDADSEPIVFDKVHLVVPPSLEVVALNILNASELWITGTGGGNTDQQVHVANWMRNRMQLSVNYYLPIVDGTQGNTAWYLIGDPSNSRPAMEIGFLRGHQQPEIFMRDSDAIRIGGPSQGSFDGEFDTDAIRYKIRHVFGGTLMDYKAAVASKGTAAS